MKQIFIGLIAICAITFSAGAQTMEAKNEAGHSGHHQKHHGKHDKAMMFKNLNLSDAQKQQVKSMNENFKNKMQALKKNDNMTVKDFRLQKEALMAERKTNFQSILTHEQKNKIEQNKKDMMAKHSQMHEKRMEKMKTELSLTNDQVAKMKAQREAFKAKAETIKNDQSLTQDQKKDQFMTLRKEQKENFKSILTADQQKKLEERKNKRSMKTT